VDFLTELPLVSKPFEEAMESFIPLIWNYLSSYPATLFFQFKESLILE